MRTIDAEHPGRVMAGKSKEQRTEYPIERNPCKSKPHKYDDYNNRQKFQKDQLLKYFTQQASEHVLHGIPSYSAKSNSYERCEIHPTITQVSGVATTEGLQKNLKCVITKVSCAHE